MDRDVLLHHMTERFQELYSQALDALDRAPEGQWIAASERVFLDVFRQLSKESFEAALQSKVDAHPTAAHSAASPLRRLAAQFPSESRDGGSASAASQE